MQKTAEEILKNYHDDPGKPGVKVSEIQLTDELDMMSYTTKIIEILKDKISAIDVVEKFNGTIYMRIETINQTCKEDGASC